jgi:sugar (pentulose or hexulose) kinase
VTAPPDGRQAPGQALILGIDCSTTGSKAVVVDVAGRTVAVGRSPLTSSSPRPGWHVQDAGSWWTATDAAVRQALAQLRDRGRLVALCITHQRESFVAVDAENRPLHAALLWFDARAGVEIAEYGTLEMEAISGKPADITPALYKLAWIRRHRPDWLAGADHVVDTHAYLVRELTGRWDTSVSSADPLALLDVTTRDWSEQLLEVAGVRQEQLPQLHDAGTVLGSLLPEVATAWGVPADLAVVAGLGDGQAAGIGAGVLDSSQAYLNLGTAVIIGTEHRGYRASRSYRSLLSVVPGNTTLEVFLSSGTYLPTWFRRQLGTLSSDDPDPELEVAATAVPVGSNGLLTLPYWNAAQSPHWDPHASGAVIGWRGMHTRAHVYRSLFEGIAQELRLQLDGLEAATGASVAGFRAMGGGTRSPLFTQIVADVLERPLEICNEPEISALGAAVVAAVAVGAHPDLNAACAAMTGTGQTVHPDRERGTRYANLRSLHAQVYPQLRELMKSLDGLVQVDEEGDDK